METVMLRTTSHRSRERLDATIGRHPQYYYTWEDGGCFAEVTVAEYQAAKDIKGITKTRRAREELHKCWPTDTGIKP